MTNEMTLADATIRELFRPKTAIAQLTTRPPAELRMAVARARKFMLDESMSAFMADIASVPFRVAHVRRGEAMDSLRHGALLPHPVTWIEYNGHAFRQRLNVVATDTHDVYGHKLADKSEIPPRFGFLLEQHPQLPHVIRMTEFVDMEDRGVGGLPFTFVWNCKDEPLPYNNCDIEAGQFATGITNYVCPQIGVHLDHGVPPVGSQWRIAVKQQGPDGNDYTWHTHGLLAEFTGGARYAICLLATLNDIPILRRDVKQQRGYVARGQYRKFTDHTVLTLNVPVKMDTKRLARKVVGLARKRWHEVRSHWRMYQRGPGVLCAPGQHAWGPLDDRGHANCTACSAWRTWITLPEGRGDASKGVVTHTYNVTHDQ